MKAKNKNNKPREKKHILRSIGNAIKESYISLSDFIKENRKPVKMFLLFIFIFGIVSFFLTERASIKENLWYLLGILPRTGLFAIFGILSLLFKRKRTFFIGFSYICFAWVTFPKIPTLAFHAVCTAVFICLAFFAFILDKKRPFTDKYKYAAKRIALWLCYFTGIVLVVEIIHQWSFLNAFELYISKPDIFMLNLLTVIVMGALIFIVRRRTFALTLYAFFWCVISFISYLKYSFVFDPMLFIDILQIRDAIPAALNFLNVFYLIAIGAAIVLLVFMVIFFIKKGKMVKYSSKRTVYSITLFAILFTMILGLWNVGFAFDDIPFLKSSFLNNGMPYCFVNYNVKSLDRKPGSYSKKDASAVAETVYDDYDKSTENITATNIIVFQMESFSDPYVALADYPDMELERDPMPYIRSLIEDYTSGTVTVPIIGGQTVKSEFEFLTGLSIDNVPYGYNPYVAQLSNNSCDSIVRYLEDLGYSTTAIHPYQGEYFNRYLVYDNLGFDRYISYEFMSGVEKRETQIWGNDIVLADQIEQVLDSTEGGDFVFNVTIQLHGKYYPIDEEDYCMDITGIDDEDFLGIMEYYVNEMEAEDAAIKAIIEMLEASDEPTICLFYSDHLPSFYTGSENLSNDEKFTVQFWTWNNMGLEKKEDTQMDLSRLQDYLLTDILGMNGSFMGRFRKLYEKYTNFDELNEEMEYYKLYDECKEKDFENGDGLTLGLNQVELHEIIEDTNEDDDISYIVKGKYLTDNTYIVVNKKMYHLTYVDPETCYLENFKGKISSSDTLCLRIVGEKYGNVLAESNKLGEINNDEDSE